MKHGKCLVILKDLSLHSAWSLGWCHIIHGIHVWYMYLHLVELYGKSRHIYRSSQQNLPRPQLGPFWRCLWSSFFALLQIAPLWPSRSFFHCHGALATRVARFPSTASKEKNETYDTYDTPENERPEPEKYVLKQRSVVPSPFLEKEKHWPKPRLCFFLGCPSVLFFGGNNRVLAVAILGSHGQFCLNWRVEMWYKVRYEGWKLASWC